MPLLRRQPFHKQKAPAGLREDEEVFVSKLTGEIFRDYEKFFERVILCNSLVWTCEITGKSGLTYQEAVESEEKAIKQAASLPEALQKAILFLTTLTHRSRLNDLDDDIYTFVKDRYFVGETVEVVQLGEKKKCKVVKVISPFSDKSTVVNGDAESKASVSDSDSDVVCLDDPPKLSKSPNKQSPRKEVKPDPEIHPDDFEYVVQEHKKSNIYVVKAELVSRKKGTFTREKSKLYLKAHCAASTTGIWKVKERLMKKFRLSASKFSDFFDGPAPSFKVSEAKRKPSGSRSGTFVDLTEEDKVIAQAKKEMKEKKKQWKEMKKKEKDQRKKVKKEDRKRQRKAGAPAAKKLKKSQSLGDIVGQEKAKIARDERVAVWNIQKSKSLVDLAKEGTSLDPTPVQPSFDELRKMSAEQRAALKNKEKADKLAAKLAQSEENKRKKEEEKQKKKEERDKERDRKREEKQKRDEFLKEWSKPRDDLECDDLKDLPMPFPVQTHIPSELFGDVAMVIEHLNCFAELLDLKSVFPNGVPLNEFCRALTETDTNGLLYDILRLFLTTLFELQEQEDEEADDEHDDDDGEITAPEMCNEDKSFKQLVKEATSAAQWPQIRYSTTLKKLPLDNFTITEILRLHFLSAGCKTRDESAMFRYQQRGGYTSLDDAGLEFRREEGAILKALGISDVFDLPPKDKLKILTALINQMLSFASSRDMIEDNLEKLKSIMHDLRHHRWNEQKRDKEEATFWYKKRLEERAKEKELQQQQKEEQKKAKLDKLAKDEGGKKDEDQAKDDDAKDLQGDVERHSTRQKDKLHAKQDAEFFNTPIENIQWDKITADDRVRMKDKYTSRELELMELADKLQHGIALYPLGRDRTFRRYWVFQSIPGLFVEDLEEHVPDDYFQAVPQVKEDGTKIENGEEKSTTSDKENESFERRKSEEGALFNKVEPLVNGVVKPVLSENLANGVDDDADNDLKVLAEHTASSKITVTDQIAQRNKVRWAYYTAEQVEPLMISLNSRGYREGALKATLQEIKPLLLKQMQHISLSELNITSEDSKSSDKSVRYQNVKSRNKTMQGAVKNASAQEFLELNLREMLLDIEERICIGGLGNLKIKKRLLWRDAIEQGSFNSQCEEITWSGKSTTTNEIDLTNGDDSESTTSESSPMNIVIRDLATALLQIEQGIDPKYLTCPLGEDEQTKKQKQKAALEAAFKSKASKKSKSAKDKEDDASDSEADDNASEDRIKTPLERWEESLMSATSLSQVFLYLGVLESSIVWAKSALHARCRICRRKGDGDKMLLCDGCDRGHHMYCLKPPVKKIPNGDWYCPDCRPKDIPKTPRKRRQSVFEQESESEPEDSDDEPQVVSSDDDSSSDESDDSDDDSSEEDTEEDTEEEEEPSPQPTKIKFAKGNKKTTPVAEPSRRSNAKGSAEPAKGGRSRRSQETSSKSSSRASSQEPDSKRAKRKLDIQEPTTKKGSRRSLDVPVQGRGKKAAAATSRRSLDSSVKLTGSKRKRDPEDDEDLPEYKKLASSSRGGGSKTPEKICEELFNEITHHSDAWPFLKPVSRKDAPDYFKIIKTPMDFATMRNKMNRYEYQEPLDILSDLRLVFKNCEQYNMPTAPEYAAGQKLSKLLEKRVKELKLNNLQGQKSSPKNSKGPSPRSSSRRR